MSRKPTTYDVYVNFQSVKQHFESQEYDCIKYNFRLTTLTPESFAEKRNDQSYFYSMSKKHKSIQSLRLFLIANFVYNKNLRPTGNSKAWIGDLSDQTADEIFGRFLLKMESFTYSFRNDLGFIRDCYLNNNDRLEIPSDVLFKLEDDSEFPYVINLLLEKQISIETLLYLNIMGGGRLLKRINKLYEGEEHSSNFVWTNLYFLLSKYERVMIPTFMSKVLSIERSRDIFGEVFEKELNPPNTINIRAKRENYLWTSKKC